MARRSAASIVRLTLIMRGPATTGAGTEMGGNRKIVGLLGAVGALASLNTAQAATLSNPTEVLKASSYADLLEPISNASESCWRLMKPKAHQEYKWLSSSSSTIIITITITITITTIIGTAAPGSLSGRAMVMAGTIIIITIIITTATGAIATNIDQKAAGPRPAVFRVRPA
jgi:hypothetical protein